MISKTHDNDIEKILENFHDFRENKLYMLAFEKLIIDEQEIVKPFLNEDNNFKQFVILMDYNILKEK